MSNLPSSWRNVSLNDLCEQVQDCAHRTPKYSDDGIPALRPRDVVGGRLNLRNAARVSIEEFELQTKRYRPRPHDIAYSRELSLGWAAKLPLDPVCLSQGMVVITTGINTLPDYVMYFLNGPGRDLAIQAQAGSAHPHLNLKDIKSMMVPVAPLEEQQRIVSAIEEACSKLDAGEAGLVKIREQLKQLRNSVLECAFSGQLLSSHSAENLAANFSERPAEPFEDALLELHLLPSNWKWARFGQVAKIASDLIDPGTCPSALHLAPNHIESWTGFVSGVKTVLEDGVTSPKHKFRAGQIIYSKIRPYLAKATIASFDGVCSADMYPIETELDPRFLLRWILSTKFTELVVAHQGRSVLPKINQAALISIPVPVPPFAEQKKIADEVDRQFSIIGAIERAIDVGLARSAALRGSVLKAAFEGNLVPQDRTDELASIRLERIRAERVARVALGAKKRRTRVAE
jgi:type I restriction enzyme, S subunit